jgi:hypothetical protein
MDTERLKRFATLTSLKRGKKSELDEIEHEIIQLQEEILEEMGREGISQARVDTDDGRFTLYPYVTLWGKAKEGNYDGACRWLKRVGLGDLVEKKFNVHKMSAVLREMNAGEQPYPKGWEKYLEVSEVYKVGVRKSNGK